MQHIIAGLVSAILGILGIVVWWSTFASVMRGVIPFALLIFGLVALLSGSRRVTAPERSTSSSQESNTNDKDVLDDILAE